MNHLKKLTILHSNDMHGDFKAESVDHGLVGGVSLLSGYIKNVRKEEKNVLYAIAGDMFCGSLIDSEYKGISTIELMNMLTPDVATPGNHEVDYGIAHLLFLEKCARFPIINANIYIKTNGVRLFQSHCIIEIDGMKIMFIGILTQDVLSQTKQDGHIGALVDVGEAAEEIGRICDGHKTEDIDLTVLLTHIGIEADMKLAELLNDRFGIDLIIGGHSHTLLSEPRVVRGIPIVQASCGTDQIGRFDIVIDTDRHAIDRYTWKLVPIDDTHCPRDAALEDVLSRYEKNVNEKYSRYITRFADTYTHPCRNRETELGKLFADVFRDALGLRIMFLGSGSMRGNAMGPIVTYRDLLEMFTYDQEIIRIAVTGAQLKRMLSHIFRPEALTEGAHTEFYQYSGGLSFVCHLHDATVTDVRYEGEAVDDDRMFNIGLQEFHFRNMKAFLGISESEVKHNKMPRVVSTHTVSLLDEWLSRKESVTAPTDARWITVL